MTSLPKRNPSRKQARLALLLGAVIASGAAFYALTHVIETAPGTNTVVVNAPLVGEYSIEKEVLVPGRSLHWKYTFGIPVKTDFVSMISGEHLETKDGKSVTLFATVKLRVTDPYLLISSFGENWLRDWAEPVMEDALESYARKHEHEYFQAMKGPQTSSFELLERIQDDFKDRSIPLEVQYAAPDFTPSSKEPRYVQDANAKKWALNPSYSK
jgi:hypothetical protein